MSQRRHERSDLRHANRHKPPYRRWQRWTRKMQRWVAHYPNRRAAFVAHLPRFDWKGAA